jgi:hypothetical protein
MKQIAASPVDVRGAVADVGLSWVDPRFVDPDRPGVQRLHQYGKYTFELAAPAMVLVPV